MMDHIYLDYESGAHGTVFFYKKSDVMQNFTYNIVCKNLSEDIFIKI